MDVLGFVAAPDEDWPGALRVTPVINGTPLTVLVRAFEERRGFDVPGDYDGRALGPSDRAAWMRDMTGRRPVPLRRTVALLGCECGSTGCWPLEARVRIDRKSVTWAAFRQPHRPTRDYTDFGPFVFPTPDYRVAVAGALPPG